MLFQVEIWKGNDGEINSVLSWPRNDDEHLPIKSIQQKNWIHLDQIFKMGEEKSSNKNH